MATISHFERAGKHGLSLVGELNIYSAATLRQELLQALEPHSQLLIDLAGIEDFDTAGVQLLLVLEREAVRQEKVVNFVRHSAVVWEVLELLNLVAELGDSTSGTHDQAEVSQ
ncbi:anti-anti-sigma regulatory factor (antagonist of anti-sigma factor) [Pseudomonas sp. GM78]|uniref:STAS domain-containing protein n=1 Tax=Pseudomonas sp. GM78 TaxID=1144337 RepID=UPI00026F73F0|nr:STAS domain-containing protein [Pseudomonas sp. GM78]EJN34237.1 anti-anti-sigma regulatory factor (antagonist of anti-sigma factor) [Pseudomonas sp. GM78]